MDKASMGGQEEHSHLSARFQGFVLEHPALKDVEDVETLLHSQHSRFSEVIRVISGLIQDRDYTLPVIQHFHAYMSDIVQDMLNASDAPSTPSLDIVEKKAFTLAKILDVTGGNGDVLALAVRFHRTAPSLFDRLYASTNNSDEWALSIVRCAETYVKFAVESFRDIWDWTPFYVFLRHPLETVRYHATEVLRFLVGLSPFRLSELRSNVGVTFDQSGGAERLVGAEAIAEGVRTFDGQEKYPTSSEKLGDVEEGKLGQVVIADGSYTAQIGRVFITRRTNAKPAPPPREDRFVMTPTCMKALESLALSVQHGHSKGVLVDGVAGAGKSALIDELSRVVGVTDVVKVHVDDQVDAKVLVGSYVCTDIPGEFQWQPGALTIAVQEGRWIVFDDLDIAPFDVISTLIPLLETGQLHIPGHGTITAAHGFCVFGTRTLIASSSGTLLPRKSNNVSHLSSHWNSVFIPEVSESDLELILLERYPDVAPLVDRFVATFRVLTGKATAEPESLAVEPVEGQDAADADATTTAAAFSAAPNLRSAGRVFSTRDVMKWAERCCTVAQLAQARAHANTLPFHVIEEVVVECLDCFCSNIPKPDVRFEVMRGICNVWGLSQDWLTHRTTLFRPQLKQSPSTFTVGRVTINLPDSSDLMDAADGPSHFSYTKHSMNLMEKLARCVQRVEPVLLSGETGVGKTAIIQYLARKIGRSLIVQNLNQQTDSSDFLGGFKPLEVRLLCVPLKRRFDKLFASTFSKKANQVFLDQVEARFKRKHWKKLIGHFENAIMLARKKLGKSSKGKEANGDENQPKKQKSTLDVPALSDRWQVFQEEVLKLKGQLEKLNNNFAFSFVEGTLVKALKEGSWVLLDEINLASPETLERIGPVLEGKSGSICLTERGDIVPVTRHPDFRIFAAMNPPSDHGKKDLPPGLRSRFTEFHVDDVVDPDDLSVIVQDMLKHTVPEVPDKKIVDFFLAAKAESKNGSVVDGAKQTPHYSLRTLTRALDYVKIIVGIYGLQRALYEALSMTFLTMLDLPSREVIRGLLLKHIIKGENVSGSLSAPPSAPSPNHVLVQQFWLEKGPHQTWENPHYILTGSIEDHLKNLARIVLASKYPVLLQGPTSSGKTSMIEYMARMTGHRFVRINNHEHTDLQEYMGSYVSDDSGNLRFHEGVLVEAVRKGHWIVLDELNLAPSEVLEALNRLLDDNRELFIAETQETVKPHPHFMLFATQNPPGLYGGRKILSRALRNRFMELHMDEIPDKELETILSKRCELPPSWCTRLVAVMKELQRHRQTSKIFFGKDGFITPRDLFKLGARKPRTDVELANHAFMILAERSRRQEEKLLVKQTLEKHLLRRGDKLSEETLYNSLDFDTLSKQLATLGPANGLSGVAWTGAMKRMFTLIRECIDSKEPVLLVGETGCGKTTICQIHAALREQNLRILNCHQSTETADFLGGLRPQRGRESVEWELREKLGQFFQSGGDVPMESDSIDDLIASFQSLSSSEAVKNSPNLLQLSGEIQSLVVKQRSLFQWYDGPLVEAMRQGDMFLIDEVSLAEDSVLERLNSVLESSRSLTLAEKGGESVEEIVAHEGFRVLATMNPSGDYGKKELSPALRNRFTEIWIPTVDSMQDLLDIVNTRFQTKSVDPRGISQKMLEFVVWYHGLSDQIIPISLRDIVSWADFVCSLASKPSNTVTLEEAYAHGACLILLDGVGLGTGMSDARASKVRKQCVDFLSNQFSGEARERVMEGLSGASSKVSPKAAAELNSAGSKQFGFGAFSIPHGEETIPENVPFAMEAPTTWNNLVRVLRSLQMPKPILLEGSPGVGKTSLILALGKATGHRVCRINLSEQTDMMDLMGSDLPSEGGSGKFQWCDGVFLQALQRGDWVLLDELNLASQSVLEGLNACLDHRAEVFIPELNRSFSCSKNFKIFACQNPLSQGGGRKGLPASFLNRFTKVYLDDMTASDLLFIVTVLYPQLDKELVQKMIDFNSAMRTATGSGGSFGRQGAPWEFNLRDIFRLCELVTSSGDHRMAPHVDTIYMQRMRTGSDRLEIAALFERIYGEKLEVDLRPKYRISDRFFSVGCTTLTRVTGQVPTVTSLDRHCILHSQTNLLENMIKCVNMKWMVILLGSQGVGKTSVLHTLGHLAGQPVRSISLSSASDTSELLGCFEQVDLNRDLLRSKASVRDFVTLLIGDMLSSKTDGCFDKAKEMSRLWFGFLTKLKLRAASDGKEADLTPQQHYDLLSEFMESLQTVLDGLEGGTNAYRDKFSTIKKELDDTGARVASGAQGAFMWTDGPLVEAVEHGHWLLIENANFCNPTVLDRLNPLLETGGTLTLTERGLLDGKLKDVTPHPNFRLFLSMNPAHGEISRAMRNRGVEMFIIDNIPSPTPNESPVCDIVGFNFSHRDALQALSSLSIPRIHVLEGLIQIHAFIRESAGPVVTFEDLLRCGRLVEQRLFEGVSIGEALVLAVEHTYCSKMSLFGRASQIMDKARACSASLEDEGDTLSIIPTIWPQSVSVSDYQSDPQLANVQFEGSLLLRAMIQCSNTPESVAEALSRFANAKENVNDEGDSPLRHLSITLSTFMESATFQDWQLRVAWIKQALLMSGNGPTSAVGVMVSTFLEVLSSNSFMQQLEIAVRDLSSSNEKFEFLWDHHPLNVRDVSPSLLANVRSMLSAVGDTDGETRYTKWTSLVPLLFFVAQHRSWARVCASQDDLQPFDSLSLYQKVLRYHSHPDERANAHLGDAVMEEYGSFETELEGFLSLAVTSELSSEVETHVELICHYRLHLIDLLSACKSAESLNIGAFSVLWYGLCKQLKTLWEGCPHSKEVASKLHIALDRVDRVHKSKSIFPSMSVNAWKYIGYPVMPSTEGLRDLNRRLVAVDRLCAVKKENLLSTDDCKALTKGEEVAISSEFKSTVIGPSARRTVAELVATFAWMCQESSKASQQELSHHAAKVRQVKFEGAEEEGEFSLDSFIQTIESAIAGTESTISRDMEQSMTPLQALVTMKRTDRRMLEEYRSACWERQLLLQIARFVMSQERTGGTDLGEQAQDFASHALSATWRDPTELSSYIHFGWWMQKTCGDGAGASGEGFVTKVDKNSPTFVMLQDMLFQYHLRVWNNTFSHIFYGNALQLQADVGDGALEQHTWKHGPSMFYLASQTALIGNVMLDWKNVSIELQKTKREEIMATVGILKNNSSANKHLGLLEWDLETEIDTAAVVLYQTLVCFNKYIGSAGMGLWSQFLCKSDAAHYLSKQTVESVEQCFRQTSTDDGVLRLFDMLVFPAAAQLVKAKEVVTGLNADSPTTRKSLALRVVGRLIVSVGQLRFAVSLPSQNLDPSHKYAVTATCIEEQLKATRTEMDTRMGAEVLVRGLVEAYPPLLRGSQRGGGGSGEPGSLKTLHIVTPRQRKLEAAADQLETRRQRCLHKSVKRDENQSFSGLYQSLSQFVSSFGNPDKVESVLAQLESGEGLGQEQLWQEASAEFVNRTRRNFSSFADVLQPVHVAVFMLKQGLRLASVAVKVTSKDVVEMQPKDISPILCFPKVQTSHTSRATSTVAAACSNLPSNVADKTTVQTLRVLFMSEALAVFGKGRLVHSTMVNLKQIIDNFVVSWMKIKREEEQRKAERDALFKYKQSTTSIKTEDEEKEEDYSEHFPTYEEEFADLAGDDDDLDDDGDDAPSANDEAQPGEKDNVRVVGHVKVVEEDIDFICGLHSTLFGGKDRSISETAELLEENTQFRALLESYSTGMNLLRQCSWPCDASLERLTATTHSVALSAIHTEMSNAGLSREEVSEVNKANKGKKQLVQTTNKISLFNDQGYNVYRDPNPTEIGVVVAPLQAFRSRLQELLEQFVEHPILLVLWKIVHRILGIPVDSPLMKVVSGLELLLRKSQEWEDYAHKGVSIREHLDAITAIIIRWRKIELASWRMILKAKEELQSRRASSWWVTLYELVIHVNLPDREQAEGDDEDSYATELFQSLEQFMLSSPIGEFISRLTILRSFANQLQREEDLDVVVRSSTLRKRIRHLLMNMYQYFSQFVPAFNEYYQEKARPIQAKMSDFIKLAKWDDSNYYRVKQSAEKSHRTLNKYAQEYEVMLQTPLREFFTIIEATKISTITAQHPKVDGSNSLPDDSMTGESLTLPTWIGDKLKTDCKGPGYYAKLGVLSKRMREHAAKCISDEPLALDPEGGHPVHVVDDLITSIIESSDSLRKETSKRSRMLKKRALVDLLRHLTSIGIPHRQNDIQVNVKLSQVLFERPTYDLSEGLKEVERVVDCTNVFSAWESSEAYYTVNVAKSQILRKAVKAPHRDVDSREIEKMLGFTDNLLSLLLQQKDKVKDMTASFAEFATLFHSLDVDNGDAQKNGPPVYTAEPCKLLSFFGHVVDDIVHFTSQCEFANSILQGHMQLVHGSAQGWQSSFSTSVAKLSAIRDGGGAVPVVFELDEFLTLSDEGTKLGRRFIELLDSEMSVYADGFGVSELRQRVSSAVSKLQTETQHWREIRARTSLPEKKPKGGVKLSSFEEFTVKHDEAVKSLLLFMQHHLSESAEIRQLYERLKSTRVPKAVKVEGEEQENVIEPQQDDSGEEMFVSTFVKHCANYRTLGSCKEAMQSLAVAAGAPRSQSEKKTSVKELSMEVGVCGSLVHATCPLARNVLVLAARDIVNAITFHRELSKLLSILLNLFTALVREGFCTPDEQEDGDEKVEENASGTGMGEGEGNKDVTDEIEDEEQLLGTQNEKKEEQEKNDDPVDQDEGLEMENDFEGDMHDVKKDEEKEEENDSDKDDEEGEEMDREMGEEGKDEEVVDEKLWDEEDEKEEGKDEVDYKDKAKDDGVTDEVRGKEDDGDEGGDDKDKKNPEQKEGDDPKSKEGEEEDGEGDDEEEGDGDDGEDDGDGMEDEGAEDEEEGGGKDPMQETDIQMQDEEEFELPDNLDLDDDDGGEDKQDDAMGDVDEGDDDEDGEGEEEEKDEKMEDNPHSLDDEEDEKKEEEADAQDDKPAEMEEETPGGEGEDQKEDEKEDEEQNPLAADDKNEAQAPAEGTENPQANDSRIQDDTNEDNRQDGADMEGAVVGDDDGQRTTTQASAAESMEEAAKQRDASRDINPYRSVGDAAKKWRERVEVSDKPDQEMETNEDTAADAANEDQKTFEFVKDNEESNEQALGSATEGQSQSAAPQDEEEEDEAAPMDTEEEPKADDEQQPHEGDDNQQKLELQEEQNKRKGALPPNADVRVGHAEEDQEMEEEEEEVVEDNEGLEKRRLENITSGDVMDEDYPETTESAENEPLTAEEISALRSELDQQLSSWGENQDQVVAADEGWQKLKFLTSDMCLELCNQLRLILEPLLATKLQGDYRTGKRINMKKVIPYIASQFKKDKIWLRRTKPDKRAYQVMVAIDDSESMTDNKSGSLACEALCVICNAMAKLEVGELAIASFGESFKLLHPFDQQFSDSAGARTFSQFTFKQKSTDYESLLRSALTVMEVAKTNASTAHLEHLQLLFVISDGRISDRTGLKRWIHEAASKNQLICFIIIENPNSQDSILEIESISYQKGKIQRTNYMDKFPFLYYIVVRDLESLPYCLGDALRQWFEMMPQL